MWGFGWLAGLYRVIWGYVKLSVVMWVRRGYVGLCWFRGVLRVVCG